jgi:hypothetical protein
VPEVSAKLLPPWPVRVSLAGAIDSPAQTPLAVTVSTPLAAS